MLPVFGFDDAPHGHAEIVFDNVRVPARTCCSARAAASRSRRDGSGPAAFTTACASSVVAERALELMCARVKSRVAFGKPLAEQGTIRAHIAESRIEIDQARLLTLRAA